MNGKNGHMLNEPDIGSGEKTPGQEDTEKIIEQIGQNGQDRQRKDQGGDARSERDKEGRR